MIVGIGCDVVNHKLTHNLGWSPDLSRLQRIFTSRELELYKIQNTDRFISGRFAVKEAVLKCLGTGIQDGIALTDIEVLSDGKGKPLLTVNGEVKALAQQLGIKSWHISISHTIDNSTAFVIAEK